MEHCKIPCNECPFRKNSLPGWLADYTPQSLHSFVMSENPFPCHMTHEVELSFEEAGEYPLCAGALRYMRKNAKMPRNPEVASIIKSFKPEDLENVLSTIEFFNHHDLKKKYGEKKKG